MFGAVSGGVKSSCDYFYSGIFGSSVKGLSQKEREKVSGMGGQKGLSVEGEKEELAKLLRTAAQQWLLRELDDGKGVGQGVELPASLFLSSLKVASNTAAGANWTCTAPRRLHREPRVGLCIVGLEPL